MTVLRTIILTLVLSATAAALGVWGGVAYVGSRARHEPSLHDMLHDRLDLTAQQQRRIDDLERRYAAKRQALEAEMRAANAELATAYGQSHAYTPGMQAAIDRFHRAMDELQTETMIHVIAMRAVLTPEQAAKFDDTVVVTLTVGGRDRR
jgi:Spy/CpxP family protein refolding chaperone